MAIISTTTFNTLTDNIGSIYLSTLGNYYSLGVGNNTQPLTNTALTGVITSVINNANTNLLTATGSSTTFSGLSIGQIINNGPNPAGGTGATYYRVMEVLSGTQCVVDTTRTEQAYSWTPPGSGTGLTMTYNGVTTSGSGLINYNSTAAAVAAAMNLASGSGGLGLTGCQVTLTAGVYYIYIPGTSALATTTLTISAGTVVAGANFFLSRDWGESYQARTAETTVLAINDYAQINALLTSVHSMQNAAATQNAMKAALTTYYAGLNQVCSNTGYSGVSSPDTFAYYWNLGAGAVAAVSYNQAMFSPDYAQAAYYSLGTRPSAWNVYPPNTPNMGSLTSGTFTAGFAIDGLNYAGFPTITINYSGSLTGSGSPSITINAYVRTVGNYNTVGAISTYASTAQARTYTVSTATGSLSGSITFTPSGGNAGDQILQITGMSVTSITGGGTIQISGLPPSGRSWPNTIQSA